MAGWANRINQNEQSVVVAVWRNADHIQEVTRGFPFRPQALFGAREKRHLAAVERFCQCLLVHVSQHQHFA